MVLAGLTGRKLRDREFVASIIEAFTGLEGLRIIDTTRQAART
ncbi:hypothetical protein [Hyperthermus butylicus]|nr:hypothetical protein [Hyperthermus butylicus]